MDISEPGPRRERGGARELLAHVWFTIGYPPFGSAVLVTLRDDGSPGLVARVDLPRRSEHTRPVAATLAAAARQEGDAAAVVVVVQPVHARRPAVLVRAERALVRAVHTGLRRHSVALADVLVVGRDRFRSVLCIDPACCPDQGRPLGDLRATATGTAMLLLGRALAADEHDLVADVTPRPWPPATPAGSPLSAPAALERWRAMIARRLAVPAAPDPAPHEVAWLVPALADLCFRDAAVAALLPVPAELADDCAAGRVRDAAAFAAAETVRPDAEVLEAGRALLAAVARGASPGSRADALAVLAWASWWQGSGARSRLLAATALDDQPEHRLALLVDELLLHGVRPPWIRGVSPSPRVP